MKKLLALPVILIAIVLFTVPITVKANSAARGWCEYGNQTVSIGGLSSSTKVQKSFPSCTVTVFVAGTATPATIFSDNAGSPTPLANPFTAQSNGSWQFFAAQGLYDVVLSGASLPTSFTLSGVGLFDSNAVTTINAVTLNVSGNTVLTGTLAAGATTISGIVTSGGNIFTAVLFAALGAPSNGTVYYCSNCTIASPCASGGTGAIAKRLNNGWVCN
jgi:hypothetical protein